MKQFIYLLFLMAGLGACKEEADPEIRTLENYHFGMIGGDQRVEAGSLLPDSVGVIIQGLDSRGKNEFDEVEVWFDVKSGGGSVENQQVTPSLKNLALTRWKTGTEGTWQELEAKVYKKNGDFLKAIDIRAYGLHENKWDTLYAGPDILIHDMVYNEPGDTTFFTTQWDLYGQGKKYFQWEQSYHHAAYGARSLECDARGNFYLVNAVGEVFKSTDRGIHWQEVTEPVPGYENNLDLQTTSNNYLWVTTQYGDHGLRCSRDGGNSWSTDTAGLPARERISDIYHLSGRSFLLLTQSNQIYESSDDGHTWKPFPSPSNPRKLYVTGNQQIIVMVPESHSGQWGYAVYRSNDTSGGGFTKINHIPSRVVSLKIRIYQYNGKYYLGIPFTGVYRTVDFTEITRFAGIPGLRGLFMSAEGILIGTHIQREKVYYRKLHSE